MKALSTALALCAASLTSPSIAAIQTIDVNGVITAVDPSDPYGAAVGDAVSLTATYDDSALFDLSAEFGLTNVQGFSFSDNDANSSLLIQAGGLSWDENDDVEFGNDFGFGALPLLILRNGQFLGLDYAGVNEADAIFALVTLGNIVFDDPPGLFSAGPGTDVATAQPTFFGVFETTAVPEPQSWAMMLAGFGLLGATLRRRKPDARPLLG